MPANEELLKSANGNSHRFRFRVDRGKRLLPSKTLNRLKDGIVSSSNLGSVIEGCWVLAMNSNTDLKVQNLHLLKCKIPSLEVSMSPLQSNSADVLPNQSEMRQCI